MAVVLSLKVETTHLQYLVAAAEHRSFRRAAVALNIAQPTLSKRIRELEDRLGVLLFERTTAGAYLTAVGDEFVDSARRTLSEFDRMEARAKAIKNGNAGRLEIGFYTSLSGPLRECVIAFNRKYDQVDVNIIEDNRSVLVSLLDRGAIDIVITLGERNYRDFAHLALWSERIMVVFPNSHRLAEHNFVYWTDLKNERFLVSQRDPGPEIQDILISKLTAPGERPFIKPVKAHHSAIICAVDSNGGIALACESSSTLPSLDVVFREIRDGNGPSRVGFAAYWRRNNENPALKQFLDSLQSYRAIRRHQTT